MDKSGIPMFFVMMVRFEASHFRLHAKKENSCHGVRGF
jgi:hypothetical protein